jgi:hypothetical protein
MFGGVGRLTMVFRTADALPLPAPSYHHSQRLARFALQHTKPASRLYGQSVLGGQLYVSCVIRQISFIFNSLLMFWIAHYRICPPSYGSGSPKLPRTVRTPDSSSYQRRVLPREAGDGQHAVCQIDAFLHPDTDRLRGPAPEPSPIRAVRETAKNQPRRTC